MNCAKVSTILPIRRQTAARQGQNVKQTEVSSTELHPEFSRSLCQPRRPKPVLVDEVNCLRRTGIPLTANVMATGRCKNKVAKGLIRCVRCARPDRIAGPPPG